MSPWHGSRRPAPRRPDVCEVPRSEGRFFVGRTYPWPPAGVVAVGRLEGDRGSRDADCGDGGKRRMDDWPGIVVAGVPGGTL